jgi:hypothetical protein
MSKEEEERSELNTQQRRVGLPPPPGSGWKEYSDPSPRHAP